MLGELALGLISPLFRTLTFLSIDRMSAFRASQTDCGRKVDKSKLDEAEQPQCVPILQLMKAWLKVWPRPSHFQKDCEKTSHAELARPLMQGLALLQ